MLYSVACSLLKILLHQDCDMYTSNVVTKSTSWGQLDEFLIRNYLQKWEQAGLNNRNFEF